MGAFEQLFGPVRGGFEQKFSKNSNAGGGARGGGAGILKLRFDWYITNRTLASRSSDFVNYSYDYRTNWTPLSPITIINLVALHL